MDSDVKWQKKSWSSVFYLSSSQLIILVTLRNQPYFPPLVMSTYHIYSYFPWHHKRVKHRESSALSLPSFMYRFHQEHSWEGALSKSHSWRPLPRGIRPADKAASGESHSSSGISRHKWTLSTTLRIGIPANHHSLVSNCSNYKIQETEVRFTITQPLPLTRQKWLASKVWQTQKIHLLQK